MDTEKIAYNCDDAAQACGCSLHTISLAIRRGELPAIDPIPNRRTRVVLRKDLLTWLDRRRATTVRNSPNDNEEVIVCEEDGREDRPLPYQEIANALVRLAAKIRVDNTVRITSCRFRPDGGIDISLRGK